MQDIDKKIAKIAIFCIYSLDRLHIVEGYYITTNNLLISMLVMCF